MPGVFLRGNLDTIWTRMCAQRKGHGKAQGEVDLHKPEREALGKTNPANTLIAAF